jgi:hypothetical protein
MTTKKPKEAVVITIELIPDFASAMVACLDAVKAGTPLNKNVLAGLMVLRGVIASALIESLRPKVTEK